MGRYRNVTILAAALFVQVLGLAVQVKRAKENQPSRLIRVWAVAAITPLEKGIVLLEGGAGEIWRNYFYLRGVRQENRALREQLEQMELEEVRLRQDAEQARRLQALLGFKEQFVAKTIAAQVIGASGSEQSRTVFIDKGVRHGIQADMAVISSQGVVGKVIAVFEGASQVLLIDDQQSGVGAILEQSRLQGVLKGKASGELIIDKIMKDEDVKPGDRVLTSGGDQIFPKGLAIGQVLRVSKGSEFLQVTVRPAALLSHLEEVLVIVKKEERQAPASLATGGRAADILAERLPAVPDKPAPGAALSPAPAGSPSTPAGRRAARATIAPPADRMPSGGARTSPTQVPTVSQPVTVEAAPPEARKPADAAPEREPEPSTEPPQ